MATITWLPRQDNYVEGSIGTKKIYIHLKKVKKDDKEVYEVQSYYIIDGDSKDKTMVPQHLSIEQTKKIVSDILDPWKGIKDVVKKLAEPEARASKECHCGEYGCTRVWHESAWM